MDAPTKIEDILNDLIVINNDRIEGYGRALKEAKDNDLKTLFESMASHSRQFKTELTSELQKIGSQPEEGTKTSGKVFRAWMDVKAAVTGSSREAILGSCERGEDAALEEYNDALEEENDLPTALRTMIQVQKRQIQQDHDTIKTLHDKVHA